jgi:AraC-like DNA-binding protein
MTSKQAAVACAMDSLQPWPSRSPGPDQPAPPRPASALRAWPTSEPNLVALPTADAEVVLKARVRAYVDAYLSSTCMDTSDLQRHFRISRRLLYRLFDDAGGVARYIRERRLEAAYEHIMRNPRCSLTRLLYDVGFNSDRQFQRAFRARYGMSPLELRQRQAGKVAPSLDD